MKLLVAKNSGFCFGVRRAVDICHREAALKDCVYSWGKIIHNELVVEELEREGVHPVESLEPGLRSSFGRTEPCRSFSAFAGKGA